MSGTAKFIDWIILKPIAVFYGPGMILYGVFSAKGTWVHILIGVVCIVIASMFGQALCRKS